jgi:hypothetical protein
MLRDALYLARMDAAHLLRRRETLLWTFVMPIIFFYFIGTITGNSYGPARKELAVSVGADAGFLVDQLLAHLEQRDYHIIRVEDSKQFLRFRQRLSIPAGFTDSVLAGNPMTIRFDRTGEGLNADYDRVRLYRAVYTTLADLIVVSGENAKVSKEAFEKLAAEPRMLTLSVKPAGKRLRSPLRIRTVRPRHDGDVHPASAVHGRSCVANDGAQPGHSAAARLVTNVARRGRARKMGRTDVAGSRPDRICDDYGQCAVLRPVGPEHAGGRAGVASVRVACHHARDVAGQLRTHRRPGNWIRSNGKQRLRWTGWLLVAHRDHAALDTKARDGVSHGLDDGCSSQADELRRVACKRSPAFMRDRSSGSECGVRPVTVIPISVGPARAVRRERLGSAARSDSLGQVLKKWNAATPPEAVLDANALYRAHFKTCRRKLARVRASPHRRSTLFAVEFQATFARGARVKHQLL